MTIRGLGQLAMRQYEEALITFERCYEKDPNIACKVLLSLTNAVLGKEQEAKELMKGSPFNLRQLMWIFYEIRDEEFFSKYALKAGMKGKPGGYYKIVQDYMFTERQIKNMILNKQISGYDFYTGKLWSLNSKDEEDIIFKSEEIIDHIKVWVEDNMFCRKWNNLFSGLRDCAYVYKNPEGSFENKDEYILVTDYGFYGFSEVD